MKKMLRQNTGNIAIFAWVKMCIEGGSEQAWEITLVRKYKIKEKEFISESAVQKRYSIYHAFQIAVEITADLAAMMVKDEQIVPKDDYSNISTLYEKKIIESEICSGLKEANGLRNRIVHDYNGLDDSLAYERILDLMTIFKEFRKEVNKWLRKNS